MTMITRVLLTALASALFLPGVHAEDGFTPLFDGKSLNGWITTKGEAAEIGGWVIEDGDVLHRKGRAGDLLTFKQYGDFELRFEWKISPKGNSGVKYRVQKFGGQLLGPEYQVLDDSAHPDGRRGSDRQTASLYVLKAADPEKKKLKPVGEWNSSRIVAKGPKLQHYLNGELVMEMVVGSEEWKTAVAKSKFKGVEGFGLNPRGRIMLQDHNDPVWYRNIEIKEL